MEWVEDLDAFEMEALIREAHKNLTDFYEKPLVKIHQKLMTKLERGAREHGAPIYPKMNVLNKEIEDEMIDLLGWTLVKKWNLMYNKRNT